MFKRSFKLTLLTLLVALGATATASAKWVSSAKVTRVRVHHDNGGVDVWFDRDVASGCTYNSRATAYSYDAGEQAGAERIANLATVALLTGRSVEVSTSGCQGSGNGGLIYISLQ